MKDLDSSPWKANPVLVQSAYKRCHKQVWKWKRIVNQSEVASSEWCRRGWPLPKLSEKELQEERAHSEKVQTKGKRKRGHADKE